MWGAFLNSLPVARSTGPLQSRPLPDPEQEQPNSRVKTPEVISPSLFGSVYALFVFAPEQTKTGAVTLMHPCHMPRAEPILRTFISTGTSRRQALSPFLRRGPHGSKSPNLLPPTSHYTCCLSWKAFGRSRTRKHPIANRES